MKFRKSLFIFRRDLRIQDNTALLAASRRSEKVATAFIFNPKQLRSPYASDSSILFMLSSLQSLSKSISKAGGKLHTFAGDPPRIISKLSDEFDAIFFNRDYTPYSRKRDAEIFNVCDKKGITLLRSGDALLHEPDEVSRSDGKPYSIFSAFLWKSKSPRVRKPDLSPIPNLFNPHLPIPDSPSPYTPPPNPLLFRKGGREEALKIIKSLKRINHAKRQFPAFEATTGLSAHNKFGTISIRELYYAIKYALGPSHPLINELYWRDFFTHVLFHFPRVLGQPFYPKYKKLRWEKDEGKFRAWCEGMTGFPFIDAGMRQLNATGFMHNRARMASASFLTKDLHIDWRKGEQYFAQKLIDYDPAVNNGNWQWSASTGCDAQPYFRIFNPWLQQRRFDPLCEYVKRWIPELRHLPSRQIHTLYLPGSPRVHGYPRPMVSHPKESARTLAYFRKARS